MEKRICRMSVSLTETMQDDVDRVAREWGMDRSRAAEKLIRYGIAFVLANRALQHTAEQDIPLHHRPVARDSRIEPANGRSITVKFSH